MCVFITKAEGLIKKTLKYYNVVINYCIIYCFHSDYLENEMAVRIQVHWEFTAVLFSLS